MSTFKDLRNIILAAAAAGFVVGAAAQSASHSLPGGGWYYDPSVHGILDLKAIRPIEGCNLPGGLTQITSSDEPGVSAPFWCGTPPFCLTASAPGVGERCTILQYARRSPRYSATGTPGANSVRNPEDLRCENTGLQPINSRCPIVPTARITFNNSTNLNVNTGASITVRVTTTNAKPEWGGSATLNCTGANANRSPFNSKNVALNVNNYSIGSGTVPSAGTLNCTLTVSNWRGTAKATAKVTIKAPSGGGGGGGGPVPDPVAGSSCPATSLQIKYSGPEAWMVGSSAGVLTVPATPNGVTVNGSFCPSGNRACGGPSYMLTCAGIISGLPVRATCQNGSWKTTKVYYFDACV